MPSCASAPSRSPAAWRGPPCPRRAPAPLACAPAAPAAAPAELLPFLREAAAGLDIGLVGAPGDFYALPGSGVDPRPFGGDDPGYLQYSSGSTRFPLGVDIPQRALASNCRTIVQSGLDARSGDRCVSWLPLYHTMGLGGVVRVAGV